MPAHRLVFSSDKASSFAISLALSARSSSASVPCAGAGIISSSEKYCVISESLPIRFIPAAASTIPSSLYSLYLFCFSLAISLLFTVLSATSSYIISPSYSLRSLVSIFPRMPTTLRSGRSFKS